jgi:hypothetical protein
MEASISGAQRVCRGMRNAVDRSRKSNKTGQMDFAGVRQLVPLREGKHVLAESGQHLFTRIYLEPLDQPSPGMEEKVVWFVVERGSYNFPHITKIGLKIGPAPQGAYTEDEVVAVYYSYREPRDPKQGNNGEIVEIVHPDEIESTLRETHTIITSLHLITQSALEQENVLGAFLLQLRTLIRSHYIQA